MAIYAKKFRQLDATFGKFLTPIKMIIEHESDLLKKKGGICDLLFNVEKSNRFGETILLQDEFGTFTYTAEGNAADSDSIRNTQNKFIEHLQYMKEFTISAEMMEDANFGIAAEAKRRAENFVRAYYRTINTLCEKALGSATLTVLNHSKASIDLSTPDGAPLFSCEHRYGPLDMGQAQSNLFCGDVFYRGTDTRVPSVEAFEEALATLSVKLRNLLDENGDPLGYTADTIILPGNKPIAEMIAKKVCGSPLSPGTDTNSINLNYGGWNIFVLPHWTPEDNRVIIMSSEANKVLGGNMFYNRVPLTISNWIDHHTGNHVFTGRCRFGIGFGSYKHVVMAIDSPTPIEETTPLYE